MSHVSKLLALQNAVSLALRTGMIDDQTWEQLQAALVESNLPDVTTPRWHVVRISTS